MSLFFIYFYQHLLTHVNLSLKNKILHIMNILIFSKKKWKIVNNIYCNFQYFRINNCNIVTRFVDEGASLDFSTIKCKIDLKPFLQESRWKYIYDKNICCLKGSRNLTKDIRCQKLFSSWKYTFVLFFVIWLYKLRFRLMGQKPLRFLFPLFLTQWQWQFVIEKHTRESTLEKCW